MYITKNKAIQLYCIFFALTIVFILLGFTININIEADYNLDPSLLEILINNLVVNGEAILFTIITAGIYSILYLFREFVFLGAVVNSLRRKTTFIRAISFVGIHGVIEVPAIVLSATLGVIIFLSILNYLKSRKANWKFIGKLLIIDCLMIIMAALVESFITPFMLKNYIL
ncbi:stage II sporulation protein M [Lachnospira multipara]|uniref:stage II sporulation protein M n=1 Tax=Lachnospira multipara TaxID=28051 RepID=UPI000400CB10|nr:stage II sporulation protein M [Lachnospira multipara]